MGVHKKERRAQAAIKEKYLTVITARERTKEDLRWVRRRCTPDGTSGPWI